MAEHDHPMPHEHGAYDHGATHHTMAGHSSEVLDLHGLHWASLQNVVSSVLSRRPGVVEVAANPVAKTATVGFGPALTSLGDLRGWAEQCGYHCAGQTAPVALSR